MLALADGRHRVDLERKVYDFVLILITAANYICVPSDKIVTSNWPDSYRIAKH